MFLAEYFGVGDQILAIGTGGTIKTYTDPKEFLSATDSATQFDLKGDAEEEPHAAVKDDEAIARLDSLEGSSDDDIESVKSLPDQNETEELQSRRIGDIGLYKYMANSMHSKTLVTDILLCMFTVASENMIGELSRSSDYYCSVLTVADAYVRIWLQKDPDEKLYFIGMPLIYTFFCIIHFAWYLYDSAKPKLTYVY